MVRSLDFVLLPPDLGLTFPFSVLSRDLRLLLFDLSPSLDLLVLLLLSADRRVLLDLGLRVAVCSDSSDSDIFFVILD